MFETSLTVGYYSMGRIQVLPVDVRAQGAPEYPLLIIPAKLELREITEPQEQVPHFNVVGVQASLFVEPNYRRIADSIVIFDPIDYTNKRKERSYHLEFPLDAYRVNLIEEGRRGDIRFKLDFRFLIARYQSLLIGSGQQQQMRNFLEGFDDNTVSLNFEIPQSQWVKNVLPTLNLNEYFILEIPKGEKIIKEAWSYMERAEEAFRNWNSKEVFGNCREIGTLLDRTLKAKFGNHYTYGERWGRAYSKFNHQASLDLHLEDLKKSPAYPLDSIKTSKVDAEHLIIRTKALIKYAGELLTE